MIEWRSSSINVNSSLIQLSDVMLSLTHIPVEDFMCNIELNYTRQKIILRKIS